MQSIFGPAKWLWERERVPNRWMLFRRDFTLLEVPKQALAHIGAETKYQLFINGELAVQDGGLLRGPAPGEGYYDTVDIAPYLRAGENQLATAVWYWGNEGRNNIDCGAGGFLFACPALHLYSDESFSMLPQPAQMPVTEPYTFILYGGHDIGYDARKEIPGWKNGEIYWPPATVAGTPPAPPYGLLRPRPIPPFAFSPIQDFSRLVREENRVIGILPYGAHVTPYLEVEAPAGEQIDIRTDRYFVQGGPGDTQNQYRMQRTVYVTREGRQSFEGPNWAYGEKLIFTLPPSVTPLRLGYRESGYGASLTCDFTSSSQSLNRLAQKSARTLYVCMRDNFMDCPDRERGQWVGDLSVQTPQVFCALDRRADLLLKKAVSDLIAFRQGNRLVGNVPGVHFCELPGQILCALSPYGVIHQYYLHTGDASVLSLCFAPLEAYLQLWALDGANKLVPRPCDWYWLDHGDNIDEALLENLWYLLALDFYEIAAGVLGLPLLPLLKERKESMRAAFTQNFWKNGYFGTGMQPDDRAQALCLLAGLTQESDKPAVIQALLAHENATPFMEYFALLALLEQGQPKAALERMLRRYAPLIQNEDSTLWEDFTLLGTHNHAWSGGPLHLLYRYGLGICPVKPGFAEIGLLPEAMGIDHLQGSILIGGKGKAEVSIQAGEKRFQILASLPEGVTGLAGLPKAWFLNKEQAPKIFYNGQPCQPQETTRHYTVPCGGRFELRGEQ